MYFALNAAVHDAACAAWSLKRHYDGGRPIEFIRYMAERGQSTLPDEPTYDPKGLPLVPDLIEVVSSATARPGTATPACRWRRRDLRLARPTE